MGVSQVSVELPPVTETKTNVERLAEVMAALERVSSARGYGGLMADVLDRVSFLQEETTITFDLKVTFAFKAKTFPSVVEHVAIKGTDEPSYIHVSRKATLAITVDDVGMCKCPKTDEEASTLILSKVNIGNVHQIKVEKVVCRYCRKGEQ